MNNDQNFYELLSKLQALKLEQTTGEFLEEKRLPVELYAEMLQGKRVASNLDIDRHRWYETSVDVYEIYGRYLGVRSLSNIYSESSEYEDICWSYWFGEMEAVQSVSYVVKK